MYEFYYDYITNKYGNNSRLLSIDTDILMYEIKTEDAYKDCNNVKEMFDFSDYSTKSKYDNSYKLVVGRIKDETAGVTIGELVGLKPKMYLYLVSMKRQNGANKNVAATVSHNEHKDVSLNKKCLKR